MEIYRKFRVLIPDTWHIHRRNFASLFDYMKEDRISYHIVRKRSDWWKLHGDYASRATDLSARVAQLAVLEPSELSSFVHRNVSVFGCARAELLSYVLAQPDWQQNPVPSGDALLVAMLLERDREALMLNMAVAMDWIDFWNEYLDRFKPFTHCCLFSGSYIYTRTLLDVCRQRGTRTFVMEGFFTGNEFYCEERSTPIANSSDLRHDNYYRSIHLPDDEGALDVMRAQAHRALANMNNKNVKKQKDVPLNYFSNDKPTLLIIGQVLNDFSIIETMAGNVASVPTYRAMIEHVLTKTDMNVIFKAHPWEHHRPNARAAVTFDILTAYADELPAQQSARLQIVETPPLTSLLRISDWAVTLCSQGALEACNMGMKPAQFGGAFYGGKGFTHDYQPTAFDGFIADVTKGEIFPQLSLEEFRLFEGFLTRALVRHLMTNDYIGVRKLRLIFNAAHGVQAARTIVSSELSAWQNFTVRKRHAIKVTWRVLKSTPYAVVRNFIRAWMKVLKRKTGLD